jgi:hypothetical protein
MHSATKDKLVESVGRVWVCPEERSNVEQFGRSWLCWVLKKTVLEVSSGEGACLTGRLLLSVVVLSFCQWKRKWGMMPLHPGSEGFLYSRGHSIFEVRLSWMTDHEEFLPVLTDEVLGMTDHEGFLPVLTDEALGMTDHKGFLLFVFGREGFVPAEGYPLSLAE